MKIINSTPHRLNLLCNGIELVIDPTTSVARVKAESTTVGKVSEEFPMPLVSTKFGEVENIPQDLSEGDFLVVSRVVAMAMKEQGTELPEGVKVVVPANLVRENGNIVGAAALEMV